MIIVIEGSDACVCDKRRGAEGIFEFCLSRRGKISSTSFLSPEKIPVRLEMQREIDLPAGLTCRPFTFNKLFNLSVILNTPRALSFPTSPVQNHPSESKPSRVASSLCR
jgi:hypothetical protein